MIIRPIAIVGPTASGKSALALELARIRGGFELVSVDSMQVYRGMDIGTAKPTAAEQSEIRHHGLDLVDPDVEFSLAEFVRSTNASIADIESRGLTPILVGGTGLYLRAVIDALDLPGRFPEVRADLEATPDTRALHSRLAVLDPLAASRMEIDNRRRIIRALEVTVGSGRAFSSFGPGMYVYPETRFRMFGIASDREVGRRRINERVDKMLDAGLVEEVVGLREQFELSKTACQALGYREILQSLDGADFDDLAGEIKARTRSFARRQRVWFARDPRITWIGPAETTGELVAELLAHLTS